MLDENCVANMSKHFVHSKIILGITEIWIGLEQTTTNFRVIIIFFTAFEFGRSNFLDNFTPKVSVAV